MTSLPAQIERTQPEVSIAKNGDKGRWPCSAFMNILLNSALAGTEVNTPLAVKVGSPSPRYSFQHDKWPQFLRKFNIEWLDELGSEDVTKNSDASTSTTQPLPSQEGCGASQTHSSAGGGSVVKPSTGGEK